MKVHLTYFKWTGKYYDEAEYEVPDNTSLLDIWDEVEKWQSNGTLPGLVCSPNGYKEFYILVDVPGHPHNVLHLIIARSRESLEFMEMIHYQEREDGEFSAEKELRDEIASLKVRVSEYEEKIAMYKERKEEFMERAWEMAWTLKESIFDKFIVMAKDIMGNEDGCDD